MSCAELRRDAVHVIGMLGVVPPLIRSAGVSLWGVTYIEHWSTIPAPPTEGYHDILIMSILLTPPTYGHILDAYY